MKRISVFICVLSLLLVFLLSSESLAFKSDDFQYSAKLPEPVNIDSLYKVHLSGELFRKSGPDFKDLRILDQNNDEIPYVILPAEYPKPSPQYYPLKITDFKNRKGLVIISVELPKEAVNLNSIDLNTPNRDFSKKIQIEGSSDRKTWARLTDDMVYDFSSQVDLRKTTINFDLSPYRYYRLTMEDVQIKDEKSKNIELQYQGLHFSANESAESKKFRINSITGTLLPPTSSPDEYDEYSFKGFTTDQDKEGNSVIHLDAGLPVHTMNLVIQNPYFFRNIKIYTSETLEKDALWALRGNYPVFKFNFDGSSKLQTSISLSTNQNKYYKLVIENKDNPVLKIDEIQFKWPRYYLYFSGLKKNASYTLNFGSSLIRNAPQYDLSKIVRKDNWSSLQTISIQVSQIEENPKFNPTVPERRKDLWERRILYAVVFLGVLVMGIWLYKLLREGPPRSVN